MKYQLCSRDEYGQTSILYVNEDLAKVQEEAQKVLNVVNVDNALTYDAKKQNWEAYMVMIQKKPEYKDKTLFDSQIDEDVYSYYVYAGKGSHGKDLIFDEQDNIIELQDIEDEINIKLYLGNLDGKEWFATVPSRENRGEEDFIQSLIHPVLREKVIYYIKPA